MLRNAAAALAALALACGPLRIALAQDPPPAGNGANGPQTAAPLPPDPKDKTKKAIEAALADWFRNEPYLPPPKSDPLTAKSDRARAFNEIEKALRTWAAETKGVDPLRKVLWWRERMRANHPKANVKTPLTKQDITITVDKEMKFQVVTRIPDAYRGNGTEHYPLVLTVIDKDADFKKVLPAQYEGLFQSHIILAVVEDRPLEHTSLLYPMIWADLLYRVDRDRVVVDGIGKAARLVENLAPEFAVQFQGAILRAPSKVHPLAKNLGLFPCWAFRHEPGTEQSKAAVDAVLAASPKSQAAPVSGEPDAAGIKALQQWIAALPPRAVSDQSKPFTWTTQFLKDMRKWGYWILANEAVDEGPIEITVDRDPAANEVRLKARNLSIGMLLLNDEILDLDRPVVVRVNGIEVARQKVTRDLGGNFNAMGGILQTHHAARDYFVTALLPFEVTGDARIPEADRKAAEEAARKAAEEAARRAAEEAARAWQTDWKTAFQMAVEMKRSVVVVLDGAPDAAEKAAVDAFVADPAFEAASAETIRLRLATAGDAASAEAKDALKKLGTEAAPAAAPAVAVFGADGNPVGPFLFAADLADLAAAAAKVSEAIAAARKPKPGEASAPPAPAEAKPISWAPDWKGASEAAAKEKKPILAVVDGAPDAAGQAAVDAILARPEVSAATQSVLCVRLASAGEKAVPEAKEILAKAAADAAAPAAVVLDAEGKPVGSLLAADFAGDPAAAAKKLVEALEKARPKPPEPPSPPAPPAGDGKKEGEAPAGGGGSAPEKPKDAKPEEGKGK